MKKIFTFLILSILLSAGHLTAQQINSNFDAWEDCYPTGSTTQVGQKPVGWTASNVYQIIVKGEFITKDDNRITENPGYSVKMTSKFLGFGSTGANAPAFITLGDMWVWADAAGLLGGNDTSDGGVMGGKAFTQRPDSLVLYYKRKVGEEKPDEPGRILLALWKGQYKSKIPTGKDDNNQLIYADAVDQMKNILGHETPEAGSDGVLIGKIEYTLSDDKDEWTRLSLPIEYLSEETPEKLNIVLSSNNFWVRPDIGKETSLWVDDLELVNNAELRSLKIGSNEVTDFNPKQYEYQFPATWLSEEIQAVGYGVNSSVDIQTTGNKKEIVVTDNTAEGTKSYTYTLTFKGEPTVIIYPTIAGNSKYANELTFTPTSNNPDTDINISIMDTTVVKMEGNTLKFLKAGTTALLISQEGSDNYAPVTYNEVINVEPLPLTVKPNNVTSKFNSTASYTYSYEGLVAADAQNPSKVFTTAPVAKAFNGEDQVTSTTPVGSYPIRFTNSAEVVAPNYIVTLDATDRNLTIEKGEVKLSFQIKRKAGEAIPEFVMESIKFDGLVTTDRNSNSATSTYYPKATVITSGTATIDFTDESIEHSNDLAVGKYPVTLTCNMTADNYNFVINETDNYLLIQETATLELVNFPDEVFYGDVINIELVTNNGAPTFRYTANSVSGATNTSFSSNTMTAKGVGAGKITLSVNEGGVYTSKSIVKEFQIKKAPLTISAQNETRKVGEENPVFTVTYNGFKLDQDESVLTATPSATCSADETSSAGTYDIVVSGGEAANYEITHTNGTLTVTDNTIGVNLTDAENIKVYVIDGVIYLTGNTDNETVRVYNTLGVLVKSTDKEEATFAGLPLNTIYIIETGKNSVKILLTK